MLSEIIMLIVLILFTGYVGKKIFYFFDQALLKRIQKITEFFTVKIGKNNHEISILLLVILNASSIILFFLSFYFVDPSTDNLIICMFPAWFFFYYLNVIKKARKMYGNIDGKITTNYVVAKDIENCRATLFQMAIFSSLFIGYIFLYFKPEVILFSFKVMSLAFYTDLCNLLVVYFASCLPASKEKSTIKQWLKNLVTKKEIVEIKT